MSGHPIDRLICDLIATGREATPEESTAIMQHVSGATFNLARRNIPPALQRKIAAAGHAVPPRGNDLIYHWAKHVIGDEQWDSGTSTAQYWADVLAAIANPRAGVIIQPLPNQRKQRTVYNNGLAILSRISDVIPAHRLGDGSGPEMIVIYQADTGRIISAYMLRNSSAIVSRPGTTWLRRLS